MGEWTVICPKGGIYTGECEVTDDAVVCPRPLKEITPCSDNPEELTEEEKREIEQRELALYQIQKWREKAKRSGEGESQRSDLYQSRSPDSKSDTNPSLTEGSPPIVEYGENVFVEHFVEKEACDRRSFRVIKPNPEHILTICCPKGHWNPETERCEVGTVRQKLEHLHPEEK